MKHINEHFSQISKKYRELRSTDEEIIVFIKERLKALPEIQVADVGCGEGRYSELLFKHFGDKLRLNCIDQNHQILAELKKNLTQKGITNFETISSTAKNLPLPPNSLDCVLTFNAIQHFDLLKFLQEAARVLKEKGYLYIYTRLKTQNERNIWGRYFPHFFEKETRLYELEDLKQNISKVPSLKLEIVKNFKFARTSTLEKLIYLAKNHHYSSFLLYEMGEFEKALEEFENNIQRHFKSPEAISWVDEYCMLVIRKC